MFIDENIKKAFVKDFSLPISIFEEEHFQYSLKQIDKYYDSLNKYQLLKDYLNKLKESTSEPEEAFFAYNKNVTNSVIDSIKNNKIYTTFTNSDMNKFKHNLNISKTNQLYKSQNENKSFVSVDLVKANFQVLKFIDPNIVLGFNSYEELISSFSDFNYHIKSKKIRQVIFGNLNPKRQQTVQKYIMSLVTNKLIQEGLCEGDILNCTSDELIFEFKDEYKDIIELLSNNIFMPDFDFHIDLFTLYKLKCDKPFYYKKSLNGNITLKGIPNHSILETIKHIENQKIDKRDLQFMFEGRLCEFSSSIYEK